MSQRTVFAILAALGVLALASDFRDPRLYIQAAIAGLGTFVRFEKKRK